MVQGQSTEGFYLDEQGQPQDELLFGDCEPSDPERFNRSMWEWGLERGYPEAGLESLYGPKPHGLGQ